MNQYVADTHALYWYLVSGTRLGPKALNLVCTDFTDYTKQGKDFNAARRRIFEEFRRLGGM